MKHTAYGLLLLLCSVVAVCALFLGTLSIWVGVHHQVRTGFWVPVLAGAFSIVLVLFLYFRVFRILYGHMKSPDSIDL